MNWRHRAAPRLYWVSDPVLCARRGLVQTALAAVHGGAGMVQLRDPGASGRALLEQARALVAALHPLDVPVIVNDRADIARAAGAAGVHVGQSDLPPQEARGLMGEGALVGLSVRTPEEAAAAPWDLIDHVGAGPVFATTTKADAAPAIGPGGLAAVVAAARGPVLAIGGIDAARAGACVAAGAAGVAVVSAIAAADDPQAAARALLEAMG